jgi:hypothetical protein
MSEPEPELQPAGPGGDELFVKCVPVSLSLCVSLCVRVLVRVCVCVRTCVFVCVRVCVPVPCCLVVVGRFDFYVLRRLRPAPP